MESHNFEALCFRTIEQEWGLPLLPVFPQQRKLMGSSAQISSGVRWCGSQAQVPEGSGARFRCVLVQVPEAGSGRCWRVPESSGVLAEVAGAKVPEGLGRFWRVLLALAYGQNNAPICRFEIEKTNAHDTAVYALLLLGIPPKLNFHRSVSCAGVRASKNFGIQR